MSLTFYRKLFRTGDGVWTETKRQILPLSDVCAVYPPSNVVMGFFLDKRGCRPSQSSPGHYNYPINDHAYDWCLQERTKVDSDH